MGYYAIIYDIRSAEEEIAGKSKEWEGQLERMLLMLEKYCADMQEKGSGRLVDSICCYIKEVHLYLLKQLLKLLEEMYGQIIRYAEGFYGIEDDFKLGEIAQTSLEAQKGILSDGKADFLSEAERLESCLAEISELIGMEAPSSSGVESGFDELSEDAEALRTEIGEYEYNHLITDFEFMEGMLEELKNLIAGLSGKSNVAISEYKRNAILQHPEVERLKEIGEAIESRNIEDTEGEELEAAYVGRVEGRKDWGDHVEDFMDTTVGGIYNVVCTVASPFLSQLVVGKLILDKEVKNVTYKESLRESWEFTKGYNQAVIKMTGEMVEGTINLPGTITGLVSQIRKDGLWETGGNIVDSIVSNVKEIWIEDVINGDARSRGEVLGRITATVADIIAGGIKAKAARDAKKAAKAVKKAEDAARTTEKIESTVEEAAEIADDIKGGTDVGNIAKKLDTNNIPNMTKQDIINSIPDDWNYTEHNGFVHIRDADGNIRIRIDPPDKVTNYPHVHAYDSDGNLLDSAGNIVDRKSPDGHIPYKDN